MQLMHGIGEQMSILIDIDMPKNCEQCFISRCSFDNGWIEREKRADGCFLIELPPHGRLIDADVLLEEIYKLRMWLLENNMPGAEHWVTKTYQMVDEMPTIIESEE